MLFHARLTVPVNTLVSAPYSEVLRLDIGNIKGINVYFPPGSRGTTKVRILHEERVLYPTNTEEWLSGDNVNIPWVEDYEIRPAHQLIRLEGYNEDLVFSHSVFFSFNILLLLEEVAIPGIGMIPEWAR